MPLFPRLFLTVVCLLVLAGTTRVHAADWPSRLFAPYLYVGSDIKLDPAHYAMATGQKYLTLAFLIAGKDHDLAWDGRFPASTLFYANEIGAIRANGGDVIVSFGGEAGQELALVDKDTASLQAKYEKVIRRYRLTWLDFDIEGKALGDTDANHRRNIVLARLQAAHPGLIISYTLAVNPNGILADGRQLLHDAKAQGVKIHSVNLMTMYFDASFRNGTTMTNLCMASALQARGQCVAVDPAITLGLTPCLGQNSDKTEIFSVADAKALELWASAQPWISSLSFWSVNRDAGLPGDKSDDSHSGIASAPWAFTHIFQSFAEDRSFGK